MRILHVVPAFFPATYWGGPIYALYGLCNALARIPGVELRVLTTDTAGPKLGQRLQVDSWPKSYPEGYDVYFCRRLVGADIAPALVAHLSHMVRWADVVHLTAVYSFPTIPTLIASRILGKPLVWSPQGALQRWKEASKPVLKWAWERLCRTLINRNKTVLHTTSALEAIATCARIPAVATVELPNGVDIPGQTESRTWMPGGELRLMFLGRLHPIKGIENLLRAVQLLQDRSVTLTIYGDGSPRYVSELMKHSIDLGLETQVQFSGHVEGVRKTAAFLCADVCVVPSFSENFGMVVAEALAHAVPVIVSTGTPWAEVTKRGCGSWVDNSPKSLAQAISDFQRRDLIDMGRRGREWMESDFSWERIARAMSNVYAGLLSQ